MSAANAPTAVTNSIGLPLVRIEAGEYRRGERDRDKIQHDHRNSVPYDLANESPQHRVRITRPFAIGRHEVTVGQFANFVKATGYRTDADRNGGAFVFDPKAERQTEAFRQIEGRDWRNPGFEQTDRHPVTCVSHADAVAFCTWLGKEEKATYRLPTEAEWEYAARAGTTTWYHSGNDPDTVYAHGNVADAALEAVHPGVTSRQRVVALENGDGDGFVYTASVGSLKPNAWGLHDVHGNVWEWCSDKYDEGRYDALVKPLPRPERETHVFVDPAGPKTTPQHEHGDWRSLRGGSWYTGPITSRCAVRAFAEAHDAFSYTGFRVVRELP